MAEAPTPGGVDALRTRLEFEAAGVELTDLPTIIATIKEGSATDWKWNEIITTIRDRAKSLVADFCWVCTLPGLTVSEEEMTLKEARIAQRVAGKPWLALDPVNDADATVAVLAALFHSRLGLELVDAAERAESLPQLEVAAAFSQRVVKTPFGGASKRQSTSASRSGSGRRRSPKTNGSTTSAG